MGTLTPISRISLFLSPPCDFLYPDHIPGERQTAVSDIIGALVTLPSDDFPCTTPRATSSSREVGDTDKTSSQIARGSSTSMLQELWISVSSISKGRVIPCRPLLNGAIRHYMAHSSICHESGAVVPGRWSYPSAPMMDPACVIARTSAPVSLAKACQQYPAVYWSTWVRDDAIVFAHCRSMHRRGRGERLQGRLGSEAVVHGDGFWLHAERFVARERKGKIESSCGRARPDKLLDTTNLALLNALGLA
ncbi:hypothetical protein B0H19DRAFT_1237108, partial [Mycena capillaripes]